MKSSGDAGKKRLSFPVILVTGIFCAALLLVSTFVLRQIHIMFAPTVKNSERLLAKGKPKEAMAHLNKAPVRRDDGKVLLLRGKVLYAVLMEQLREERWGSYGKNPKNWLSHPLADEAEKCFLDAMAISPNDAEVRLVLGNLYREQGRFGDSESMLRSAIEIDGKNSEAFLALGLLYAEGGRRDAALRALSAAWEFDAGNPQIAKNIAYFYRYYGDAPGPAIEWFTEYLNCAPKRDPDANMVRTELRDLMERYPEFGEYSHEKGETRSSRRVGGGRFATKPR